MPNAKPNAPIPIAAAAVGAGAALPAPRATSVAVAGATELTTTTVPEADVMVALGVLWEADAADTAEELMDAASELTEAEL